MNRVDYFRAITIILAHLGCLGVFFAVPSWQAAVLGFSLYILLVFGVSGGYHRYFSHRSYRVGRTSQFLLAWLAQVSNEGGITTWVQIHDRHHRYTDTSEDAHSPILKGFWWAYLGWTLTKSPPPCHSRPYFFNKFPEIRWLDRHHYLCFWSLAAIVALFGRATSIGAFTAFSWFCMANVLSTHGTFMLSSWGHLWGSRRFETPDNSRNSMVLALITLGEGWHNNHHQQPASSRFGIAWWEVDPVFSILRVLAWVGVVKDLRVLAPGAARTRLTRHPLS
jgi:stearoyl-CoA desaturase (delta-9 desaturase)